MRTKKPTLLGGGCVEICLKEVMSPSPGELLQEGDLNYCKVPLCGFGGVKCECVCFFA